MNKKRKMMSFKDKFQCYFHMLYQYRMNIMVKQQYEKGFDIYIQRERDES